MGTTSHPVDAPDQAEDVVLSPIPEADEDETETQTIQEVDEDDTMDTEDQTISETDQDSTGDQSGQSSLSQLRPTAHPRHASPDLPPPRQKPRNQAKCQHPHMTRVYSEDYTCHVCKRPGAMGWLYRCTVGREPLIMNSKEEGQPAQYIFDDYGRHLSQMMTLGHRGPQARADPLSYLRELTTEQLHTYTPKQLITIAEQRAQVQAKIRESITPGTGEYPNPDKPWVPDWMAECRHKTCHNCQTNGIEKTMVSLDAIAKGEVMPTVATGYGFHRLGRPVADVKTVRNLGCRPVPLPRHHPARGRTPPSALARLRGRDNKSLEAGDDSSSLSTSISGSSFSDSSFSDSSFSGSSFSGSSTSGGIELGWDAKYARENFPPRGSLRRSNHFPDLRFRRPDPFVRNALACVSGTGRNGARRFGNVDSSSNKRSGEGTSDSDDADISFGSLDSAVAALSVNHKGGARNDTRHGRIENKGGFELALRPKRLADGEASHTLRPVAGGPIQPSESACIAALCEGMGDSTTEETSEGKTDISLTEEAVELGTPDMVVQ